MRRFRQRRMGAGLVATAAALLPAAPALPETAPSLNFYGVPGLIDMPSGETLPDAQVTAVISNFAGTTRTTVGFQFSDRISAAFRYSRLAGWDADGYETYFDRSLDLRFRLVDETAWLPAVTLGLQDILGTGIYSGEYIVATKHVGDRLRLTAGLGWGRFGSSGAILDMGTRPDDFADATGGTLNVDNWFRGPAAPFAGIEWQAGDRLSLKAEYSSDAYEIEDGEHAIFERKSPFNFGVEYQLSPSVRLGAYYLYGSALGLTAQLSINPRHPALPGSSASAPLPVKPRDRLAPETWGTDWAEDGATLAQIRKVSAEAMANEGMRLEAMTVEGSAATIRLRNGTYDAEPMALGRAVRALTYILPPSVESITVVPVVNGMAASAVTFRRSDIEALELAPDGTERSLERARFGDGAAHPQQPGDAVPGFYPRLSWSVQPYVSLSMFGARDKLTGSLGLRGRARYEMAPGIILSGVVAQQFYENYESRPSDSALPHVRSDGIRYFQDGRTAVEELTASWYFRPGTDLFGRVTVGYLERMFGGASAELLWMPVDSRFALGAEVDWVKQRAFDGGFGFQDYDVVTGHLSGYLDFGEGYHGALHVGRYLAGDWGATVEFDRTFANGWKIGAYVTRTDVSYEDFGEGSFDKGLRAEIPLSWVLGKPTRTTTDLSLRSLSRDGGARLRVDGRLYESVRDYRQPELSREWSMFWR